MRRLLAPLACLALLVACGDDGEAIDPEADEERIEDALLTIDDLPDGFEESESDDDDTENECNEDVLDIDPDAIDDAETAKAGPVQFDSETTSVVAEITAFDDTELPERVLDALDDDEYLECIEEQLADRVEDGEVTGIEAIDSPADGAQAAEVTFTVGDLDLVSQQHAVLVDRFGVSLQVTALAGELDDDLVEDLLETMVDRLEDE